MAQKGKRYIQMGFSEDVYLRICKQAKIDDEPVAAFCKKIVMSTIRNYETGQAAKEVAEAINLAKPLVGQGEIDYPFE